MTLYDVLTPSSDTDSLILPTILTLGKVLLHEQDPDRYSSESARGYRIKGKPSCLRLVSSAVPVSIS